VKACCVPGGAQKDSERPSRAKSIFVSAIEFARITIGTGCANSLLLIRSPPPST
jgi:hypothetical protein